MILGGLSVNYLKIFDQSLPVRTCESSAKTPHDCKPTDVGHQFLAEMIEVNVFDFSALAYYSPR